MKLKQYLKQYRLGDSLLFPPWKPVCQNALARFSLTAPLQGYFDTQTPLMAALKSQQAAGCIDSLWICWDLLHPVADIRGTASFHRMFAYFFFASGQWRVKMGVFCWFYLIIQTFGYLWWSHLHPMGAPSTFIELLASGSHGMFCSDMNYWTWFCRDSW